MPKLNSVNVLPLLCCFILTNGLKWLGDTETVLWWDLQRMWDGCKGGCQWSLFHLLASLELWNVS